jgi:hypothetical protein
MYMQSAGLEKEHLDRELGQKDPKIKQLSGTAGKLEFELASKKLERLELVIVNLNNSTSSLRNWIKLKAAFIRTTY